jgi:hypothetical protein
VRRELSLANWWFIRHVFEGGTDHSDHVAARYVARSVVVEEGNTTLTHTLSDRPRCEQPGYDLLRAMQTACSRVRQDAEHACACNGGLLYAGTPFAVATDLNSDSDNDSDADDNPY